MSDQTLVTYEFIEAKDKEIERLTAHIEVLDRNEKRQRERIAKLEAELTKVRDGSGANGYVKRIAIAALQEDQ